MLCFRASHDHENTVIEEKLLRCKSTVNAPVLPAAVLPAAVLPAPVLPAPVLPAPVLPAAAAVSLWINYEKSD